MLSHTGGEPAAADVRFKGLYVPHPWKSRRWVKDVRSFDSSCFRNGSLTGFNSTQEQFYGTKFISYFQSVFTTLLSEQDNLLRKWWTSGTQNPAQPVAAIKHEVLIYLKGKMKSFLLLRSCWAGLLKSFTIQIKVQTCSFWCLLRMLLMMRQRSVDEFCQTVQMDNDPRHAVEQKQDFLKAKNVNILQVTASSQPCVDSACFWGNENQTDKEDGCSETCSTASRFQLSWTLNRVACVV